MQTEKQAISTESSKTRALRSMRIHRRSPAADDGADPRPSGLAPDLIQTAREHGSRTTRFTRIHYPIQHTITYNANSLHSKHPPWPLPQSAPGMRPRGHSWQRHVERWTGPAGRGEGCFGRGERVCLGWRAGMNEESDWGSHGLGMDDLQNCQGRGAAHANRLQGLAISRSRKVVILKCIAMHSIQCSW